MKITMPSRDTSSSAANIIGISVRKLDSRMREASPVYFNTQIRDEEGRWQVMNFRSSETKLGTDVE